MCIMVRVSTSTTRGHRSWQTGEAFTIARCDRALRGRPLGQGLLLDRRPTATCSSTRPRIRRASIDLKQLVDHLQLRGIGLPILIRFRDILRAPARRHPRRLPGRDHPAPVRRALLLRLPDQGQPAAAGRRGGARLRHASTASASRPAPSRSCWPSWRMADNDTPIICNGFKDAEFIEMAMLAQKIGPQHHPGRREIHRAGADPQVRREGRRPAADRHARQAGRARRRAAGSRPAATARSSA